MDEVQGWRVQVLVVRYSTEKNMTKTCMLLRSVIPSALNPGASLACQAAGPTLACPMPLHPP